MYPALAVAEAPCAAEPSLRHRGRFELLLEVVDHLFDHMTGGGRVILTHSPRFTRNACDEFPPAPKKLDTANELLHPNPQTLGRKNVLYIGLLSTTRRPDAVLASGMPPGGSPGVAPNMSGGLEATER